MLVIVYKFTHFPRMGLFIHISRLYCRKVMKIQISCFCWCVLLNNCSVVTAAIQNVLSIVVQLNCFQIQIFLRIISFRTTQSFREQLMCNYNDYKRFFLQDSQESKLPRIYRINGNFNCKYQLLSQFDERLVKIHLIVVFVLIIC